MNLTSAQRMIRDLMNEHGLRDWRLALDNAKNRAGVCQYAKRTLSFSRSITTLNAEEDIRQTALHEIAHALTPGHKHDNVWLAKARSIGYTGKRTHNQETVQAPWTGVHNGRNGCTATFPRHRRPKGQVFCPKCYRKPRVAPGIRALDDLMGAMLAPEVDNSDAAIRWVRTSNMAKS